jgi:hypothetical protein
MTEGRGLGERLAERISGPAPAAPVEDAVEWIERRFATTLWSMQAEVVRAVLAHRYVAVRAAHSVGKSKVAALLMGFWIGSKPPGSAFVFSTAPRTAQVRAILWRELGRAHRLGNLPGRLSITAQVPEWFIGDELVGIGRKPADLSDPEEAATALQGIHAEHLLVVLDEAAGLAPWVWDAVDSLAANQGARVLAIGNPTVRDSRFFEVCQPGSGWHRMVIPATATPSFTAEAVPDSVRRNLVSPEWVAERERRWGIESALYRSRVLAEFPDADDDSLIEPGWIEAAQARELQARAPAILGVDVARSGGDRTVVVENRGGRLRILHRTQGADTMQTSGTVARLLLEAGDDATAFVDEIGVGGGTLDRLREQGLPVRGFNSSARATDPRRYANRRAECFWRLRELLRAGKIDLPDDDDLAAELLSLKWSVDSTGRILIGSKSDLPRSPDLADAAMMTLQRPERRWAIAQPSYPAADPQMARIAEPDLGTRGHASLTGDLHGRQM